MDTLPHGEVKTRTLTKQKRRLSFYDERKGRERKAGGRALGVDRGEGWARGARNTHSTAGAHFNKFQRRRRRRRPIGDARTPSTPFHCPFPMDKNYFLCTRFFFARLCFVFVLSLELVRVQQQQQQQRRCRGLFFAVATNKNLSRPIWRDRCRRQRQRNLLGSLFLMTVVNKRHATATPLSSERRCTQKCSGVSKLFYIVVWNSSTVRMRQMILF